MPIHDWKRVDAGIFHDFHHEWITTIKRSLNDGLLPQDYYALAEQVAAGFGPDVLTLQGRPSGNSDSSPASHGGPGVSLRSKPQTRFHFETVNEFYRRKKSTIVVRHVSGDEIIAMIEIVSPGNKSSRKAMKAFVDKACDLLEQKIHLLIIDLFPPTKRDPNGLHSEIWEETQAEPFQSPPDKPLTLAAYECDLTTRAHVEPVAVGDVLPEMPLFLVPNGYVPVPLEATYEAAFAAVPLRWRRVLEPQPT
jgi:uncharacterized protein DUF4058